jgi:hypothetical protein
MLGLVDDETLRDLSKGIVYIYMSDVKGDIAEFGCFWGKSGQVIAGQMQRCDQVHGSDTNFNERKLWLFDSFEGLPDAILPPDLSSPHVQSGDWKWKPNPNNVPTPESVQQAISAFLPVDRIRIIAGWYKDTLSKIPADTKFAFVHVDCDLYESAYQVLDHLFSNNMLSDGCALFFDDWYCNRGNPKWGEQKAWRDVNAGAKHDIRFTDWGPYGIVGRKFIVHV